MGIKLVKHCTLTSSYKWNLKQTNEIVVTKVVVWKGVYPWRNNTVNPTKICQLKIKTSILRVLYTLV